MFLYEGGLEEVENTPLTSKQEPKGCWVSLDAKHVRFKGHVQQRGNGFSRVVKNGKKWWAYLIQPAHFPYHAPLPCAQPFCHPFAEFSMSSGHFQCIAC